MLDTFKIHTCCVKKKDIMHYFLVKCFREVGVFITGSYCNPSYPCCICLLSARLTDMYTMPDSYVFLVSIYCPILPNSGKNNLVLLSKKKKVQRMHFLLPRPCDNVFLSSLSNELYLCRFTHGLSSTLFLLQLVILMLMVVPSLQTNRRRKPR